MKELRRLLASEPMSMAGRRNGSEGWAKPGEMRGRGVAQNVGIGRCWKLLHTVKRETVEEEPERVALLKVEHPRRSRYVKAGCGEPPSSGQLRLSVRLSRGDGEGAAG